MTKFVSDNYVCKKKILVGYSLDIFIYDFARSIYISSSLGSKLDNKAVLLIIDLHNMCMPFAYVGVNNCVSYTCISSVAQTS